MRITITSPNDVIALSDQYDDPIHVWAIKKDGVSGLYGTPSTRESPLERPQMDGAYWPSRLTQGSRTISLDCVIKGASSLDAALARDRINALTCQPLTLSVEDVNGRREIDCWLTADPEPLMRRHKDGFEFGLVLSCPDPYWHGAWLWQSPQSGRLQLANLGTAPTWLQFRAASHITTLYATWGDAEIEWEGDTNDLLLDTRDMIPSAGQITVDWAMPVQPGKTLLTIRSDCSTLDVGIRPAWR
ncbi:hypothetical protein CQR55_1044 [Bifidobacterium pseudolongum subsp. globosum]|uniref:phage tail family protein n=1 Tax=Bifidobacterium pseudolongum TaxID=1694 RepID=UPI000C6FFB2B|nr:phage tail family protein [Bifidobacterium pseudolongum]PKU96709.1 hypothetical protein CQR55_1044 [Bifidobacterium pseudolongum subsp. globosum]